MVCYSLPYRLVIRRTCLALQLIGIHAFNLNRKDQDVPLALDAGMIKTTFASGDFKFDEWTRKRTQKGE